MKRGPDLDIEAIFDDLESDRPTAVDVEATAPLDAPDLDDPEVPEDDWDRDRP